MMIHSQDERASGTTAFAHLMGVTSIVIDNGGDEDEAIAALLHDTAEDHGGEARLTDISLRFGQRVADIVRGCSDSLSPDKRLRPEWHERKRSFIFRLPTESSSVWRISVADKLDNSRGVDREVGKSGAAFWKRIGRQPEELIAYWAAVHLLMQELHPSHDTNELGFMVARLNASYCDPVAFRDALERLRMPQT